MFPKAGKVWLMRLLIAPLEKTLTDADVNSAHEKILAALKTQLQAELRA